MSVAISESTIERVNYPIVDLRGSQPHIRWSSKDSHGRVTVVLVIPIIQRRVAVAVDVATVYIPLME